MLRCCLGCGHGWEVMGAREKGTLHSSEALRCLIWCLDALMALTKEALRCRGDVALGCSQPCVVMTALTVMKGGCTAQDSSPLGHRRRHMRLIKHKKSTRALFPAVR